jgi:hypothetical protein
MKDFAYKYCYIILCGADNDTCWYSITNSKKNERYFKVNHYTYIYVVYEINNDPVFLEKCEKVKEEV